MLSALSILFASSVSVVDGHGFMVTPKIRGISKPPGVYEPQSVGAAGPGQQITICGKHGADNHEEGDEVAKMPAPGSKYTIQAKITAHHLGHMIVRVCPFVNGETQYKDLKRCIRVASTAGEKTWALSAGIGFKEWTVVLPSKKELEALNSPKGVFTIQWRYNTANSCEPVDTIEDSSNCREDKCCSEVFTNCADVVFDGIESSPPDPPVDPQPRPIPSPGPRPSTGGGSGADVCVATAGWTGQQAMDDWCASTMVCGGDGGESCDCSCSGGGEGKPEPEPEPEGEVEHKIKPGAKAATIFKGLAAFCKANKEYYCDNTHTQDVAAELCECEAVKPVPAPEPSPAPAPDPVPEPEPQDDGDVKEDGLDFNACKGKCQKLCNGQHKGVKTNQGWGSPRYIHCMCTDGHEQKFKGCECKNPGCPKSMKLVEVSPHSTKFAGGVQKQVEIAAHGETMDLD